ncbi:hypothetical protein [Neisseria iguanae]|uniref:Uncharacterized protein n=1 Tax=Neisseria iguanae TaxID=90242 RepID=A0A2P7U185_9NEIS|nr:hypothetical protein [Neisseria iguanae]PSJ80736.1 hypothetical protein C7N83_04390 [Neisseria iguanae]
MFHLQSKYRQNCFQTAFLISRPSERLKECAIDVFLMFSGGLEIYKAVCFGMVSMFDSESGGIMAQNIEAVWNLSQTQKD